MNTRTGILEALIMTSWSKSTLEHNTLPEHFMKDIHSHASWLTELYGVHQHQQSHRCMTFIGALAREGECYHGL